MVANYIPEDIYVVLHSENGFVGLGGLPQEGEENVDVINSGGTYVTYTPEANFFDTATSFSIVRGGHVDATVLAPCKWIRMAIRQIGSFRESL